MGRPFIEPAPYARLTRRVARVGVLGRALLQLDQAGGHARRQPVTSTDVKRAAIAAAPWRAGELRRATATCGRVSRWQASPAPSSIRTRSP